MEINDLYLTLISAAGPVEILKGINFTVNSGETVGIVGPSGSGKSSLISVIAGLEKSSAGSIWVAGKNLDNLNENDLALFRKQHVGIIFQSFHLIPTMTALENVAIPLELTGRQKAFESAKEMLHSVGLAKRIEHYPMQLSGGEQQRVAIARAFILQPPLILADEPTGNLDSETGTIIINTLFDMQKTKNTTLIFITHDNLLASRCDRIVQMQDGMLLKNKDRCLL